MNIVPCGKVHSHCSSRLWYQSSANTKSRNLNLQGDQLNMAVFFWYKVTCPVYATVHVYTESIFTTRKTHPCLTGHPVPKKMCSVCAFLLKTFF